jgi:hypothetical protein
MRYLAEPHLDISYECIANLYWHHRYYYDAHLDSSMEDIHIFIIDIIDEDDLDIYRDMLLCHEMFIYLLNGHHR